MNNKNNLIEINKKEKLIKICTSNKKLLKKLLTYENHSEFLKLHENNYLLTCKIPLNWIKVLPPKKKAFSTEELQKRSEKMRIYNLNKKYQNKIE